MIPKWIIVTSWCFAILEIMVSLSICMDPKSVLESVDFGANGVMYLAWMWAVRQFALGIIFAVAAWRKSVQMLTITYIFFLVMFLGDALIGLVRQDPALIGMALAMCGFSIVILAKLKRAQS